MNQRSVSMGLCVFSFAACVWIALVNPGRFVRGTLGDVLVVIFLYFLVQSIRRCNRSMVAWIVLSFALAVEVLQALGISSWPGFRRGSAAEVIVGSTFDWKDCIAYGVGVFAAWWIDGIIENRCADAKQEK